MSFLKFIRQYKYTVLLTVALFITILWGFGLRKFGYHFVNIAAILLLLTVAAKIKKPFSYIIIVVCCAFFSFDQFFVLYYNAPLGLGNIASAFTTNSEEAFGYLQMEVIALWVTCLAVSLFLALKAIKELEGIPISKKILFLSASTLLIGFSSLSIFFYFRHYHPFLKEVAFSDFLFQPVRRAYTITMPDYPLLYPSIMGTGIYMYDTFDLQRLKTEKTLSEGISLDANSASPTKIYVVIGESCNRDHFSLYGYPHKTTPFLDSLAVNDSTAFNYYSAISAGSLTRDAFRFILSFYSPFKQEALYDNKSVIDLANERNYKSIWISNQSYGTSHDYFSSLFSNSTDTCFYLNDDPIDDFNLLKQLKVSHKQGEKQFFVLHTVGSHMDYRKRSDEKDEAYFVEKKIATSDVYDYDKTIHHTDRFLKELTQYTKMMDDSSVILYFSDHGEIVNYGHGYLGQSFDQFKIPFLYIDNNSGKDLNSIVLRYFNKQKGYINNMNVPCVIAEILGYRVDDNFVKKALNDADYIYHSNSMIYSVDELIDLK